MRSAESQTCLECKKASQCLIRGKTRWLGAFQSSRLLLLLRISVKTPGNRARVIPKLPETATADDSNGPFRRPTIKRERCLKVRSLLWTEAVAAVAQPTAAPGRCSNLDSSPSSAAKASLSSELPDSAAETTGCEPPAALSHFVCNGMPFFERCLSSCVPQFAR